MEEATLTFSAKLLAILLIVFLQPSFSKTVVVNDATAQANVLTLFIGDTLVFKGDDNFRVIYVFRSRKAFLVCNSNKAKILRIADSTNSFTWHPFARGNFYFTTGNNTKSDRCDVLKVKVRVLCSKLRPSISSQAPSPTPGGDVVVVSYPSPPKGRLLPPSTTTTAQPPVSIRARTPSSLTSSSPSIFPDGGSDVPFVSSDPLIPQTSGGVNCANIDLPMPVSGNRNKVTKTRVGLQMMTMLLVSFITASFSS